MLWTFAISSIALFMVTLDNLVVTTAIPVIRDDLHASLASLEWTVNAYTLTFAVLLLTGAALGDRFGRRRMFALGIAHLHARLGRRGARAERRGAQRRPGRAGPRRRDRDAADADDPLGGGPGREARRSRSAPGAAIGGLAVAFGPLVGGAVVQGISWQWIFWLNVPIGLVLVPLALARLDESYGPEGGLDLPGVGLASAGLFGIVWGLIRGNEQGWASAEIVAALAAGVAARRRRSSPGSCAPSTRCCRCASSATRRSRSRTSPRCSCTSACSARSSCWRSSSRPSRATRRFGSGLRILPWTLAPMFIAPIAGALSDRIPPARIVGVGLALQAGRARLDRVGLDADDGRTRT